MTWSSFAAQESAPAPAPGSAPNKDTSFGSWDQFAAQGGLASVHQSQGQPSGDWTTYNVPKIDMKNRIDKTLEALSSSPNPTEFEIHLRQKQGENVDFNFLQPEGTGNDYFEGRKAEMGILNNAVQNHTQAPPCFPPLMQDTRPMELSEKEELKKHILDICGTKDSIKGFSQWIILKKSAICAVMQEITNGVHNIDFNNFSNKLHICYVLNDALHESMKMRNAIDNLDAISNGILHHLPAILVSSFQGYSPADQDKMHNLLTLWSQRQIFTQEQINFIGNAMLTAPATPVPYPARFGGGWGGGWGDEGWFPPPVPPSNLLHLSPGFVVDIVLNLLRDPEYVPYTPLPLSHVPPCMPDIVPKTANYILDKFDDFERAMEAVDSRHRSRRHSRSSSRSRSRERYRERKPRRRRFSRSPQRQYSRSPSRSSSSSSRSSSPSDRNRRARRRSRS